MSTVSEYAKMEIFYKNVNVALSGWIWSMNATNKFIASGSSDRSLRVWCFNTGRIIASFIDIHNGISR